MKKWRLYKVVYTRRLFDKRKFFDFAARYQKEGIKVPIIPGLKPLSTKRQLNLIPHRFHVDLPDDLVNEVLKCKNNQAVKQVGVEWCIQQSQALLKLGVPALHYYTMGKSENIKAIAKEVF